MGDPINESAGWGKLISEFLYIAEDVAEPVSAKAAQMIRDVAWQLELDIRGQTAEAEPLKKATLKLVPKE
jgi:hypothetical protein